MAAVFVDTSHHIAILIRSDHLHQQALEASRRVASAQFVTTQPVLVELLAYVSSRGSSGRTAALAYLDELRASPTAIVVPQTAALFEAGLDLYRRRPDKGYSLTDCMSMIVCRQRRIKQVLTHDRHFEQEGFQILL